MRASKLLLSLALAVSLGAFTATASPAHAARKGAVHAKSKSKAKRSHKSKGKSRGFTEVRVPSIKGHQPNVQALGAVVVDLDSGQELWSRKPDIPRPIASISKLAATLVVAEHKLELEGLTTITRVDAQVARGGAPSRLHEGMTLTNRDLLHAALMGSDNRAVSALGRAVGLSATQLAAAMTQKAASLGLKQTRFLEPTGLSPENVSTPRETLVMLRQVMKHPLLGPIAARVEYEAHPVSRPPIHYTTTHRPAARSNVSVLGGKTGYNDAARYCLVVASRINGHTLGMAFLGTEGKMTRFGDVARVADWVTLYKPKAPSQPGVPDDTAIAKADVVKPAAVTTPPAFTPPALPGPSVETPPASPAASPASPVGVTQSAPAAL